ncbi:hypothetical protein B9G55_12335 [Saccharibacillus sp. O16]|nr:hypothetical protein B9G55_12335 [Saccharibacillus sp. O16]
MGGVLGLGLGLALCLGLTGLLPTIGYAAESAPSRSSVTITLADEPLLRGVNEVDIYRGKVQSFRLVFSQAVNRTFIQNKLRSQARAFASAEPNRVIPQLTFNWRSSRELLLTAAAPNSRDDDQYLISVDGSEGSPGQLVVNLLPPASLYVLHTDSGQSEKVSGLADHPYDQVSLLGPDGRYLLLDRGGWKQIGSNYTAAAADSLLDLETGKRRDYPFNLTTNYTGVGSFIADERGIFYSATTEAWRATEPDEVERFKIVTKQRVYGAVYSQDRKSVIAVLGEPPPAGRFDLLIEPLDGGSPTLHRGVLRGNPRVDTLNHAYPAYEPVSIVDDGENVHIWLEDASRSGQDAEWVYDPSAHSITRQPIAESVAEQPVFSPSSDGLYRYYSTGSVYDVALAKSLLLPAPGLGYWLDSTHQLFYSPLSDEADTSGANRQIAVYDADEDTSEIVAENLPDSAELVGAAGQEVYLTSRQPIR